MCETIQMMRSRVIAGDDETPMWNWHSNQDSHSKVCEKKTTDYQISINETLKSIGIRVRRSHALKPWKISFLFIFLIRLSIFHNGGASTIFPTPLHAYYSFL